MFYYLFIYCMTLSFLRILIIYCGAISNKKHIIIRRRKKSPGGNVYLVRPVPRLHGEQHPAAAAEDSLSRAVPLPRARQTVLEVRDRPEIAAQRKSRVCQQELGCTQEIVMH